MIDLKKELRFAELALANTMKYLHRTNLTSQRDRLMKLIAELSVAIQNEAPPKAKTKPKKAKKKTKGRK